MYTLEKGRPLVQSLLRGIMFVLMQPLGGRWSVSMLDVWGLSSIWSLEQLGTVCSEAQMHCRLEWTLVVACASAPDDQRCELAAKSRAVGQTETGRQSPDSRHSEFSRVSRCQETFRCSSSLGLIVWLTWTPNFPHLTNSGLKSQVFCMGFMWFYVCTWKVLT